MTIHTRPAEPIADCALSHHFPGRVVSYSEFDRELGRSVIRCATVLEHRAGVRCIAMRGSAEFTRLQSANWLLQQQNRELQRKVDTIKAERDTWRARCGR